MTTVMDLLEACKYLRADAHVRPQWVEGCEPKDHEPGVKLLGFEQVGDELVMRVELFYLDEITDEEDD